MYLVILHEALHILGISSFIGETGSSYITATTVDGIEISTSYYSRFDTWLRTSAVPANSLISNPTFLTDQGERKVIFSMRILFNLGLFAGFWGV